MTVRRVALGVYWACLVALAVLALGWVWIDFYAHLILEPLTWLLLLLALAVIVVETAVRFTRRKLVGTLGAAALIGGIVVGYPVLEWWPSVQLFYRTRAHAVNEVAREALAYGRITHLSTFGMYGSLNQFTIETTTKLGFYATHNRPAKLVVDTALGIFVSRPFDVFRYDTALLDDVTALVPRVPVDTVADSLALEDWMRISVPLDAALERTGVERERYDWFVARLQRLRLTSMDVGPRHVVFVFGAGCEPGCRLAYIPDGRPAADEVLHSVGRSGPRGSELRRVSADWYYW